MGHHQTTPASPTAGLGTAELGPADQPTSAFASVTAPGGGGATEIFSAFLEISPDRQQAVLAKWAEHNRQLRQEAHGHRWPQAGT